MNKKLKECQFTSQDFLKYKKELDEIKKELDEVKTLQNKILSIKKFKTKGEGKC